MILTNCNCGEKVDCDCGTLSFDSFLSPATSVLDVGELVSSNECALDEYVIDWYRNGELYLTSGKGYDDDITAFHPFQGEAAVIVEPGTYVPVLRYIVVNGEVLFPHPKPCQKWCDYTVDLPEMIVVTALYCGLVGTGINAAFTNYDYSVRYISGTDWKQAGRVFQFDLNDAALFFAYYYNPVSVADRLTIWHSSDLETPLVDYIAGTNLPATDYEIEPHEVRLGVTRQIIALPEYVAGAYLKIRIIPAPKETTQNTSWRIDMKCLGNEYDFCNEFLQYNPACQQFDIDTLSLTYDDEECEFVFQMEHGCAPITAPASGSGLQRYSGIQVGTSGGLKQTSTLVYGGSWAYNTQVGSVINTISGQAAAQINAAGKITFSRAGNVFTIVCDEQADYDDFKYGYDEAIKLTAFTEFIDDDTKLEYYRRFNVNLYTSGVGGCGDDQTSTNYYFHLNSVFNFNDGTKTITITAATATLGYAESSDPCNTVYANLSSFVNIINNTISGVDFSNREGYCRHRYPFGRVARVANIVFGTLSANIIRRVQMSLPYTVPCPTPGWGRDGTNANWHFFNYRYSVIITATRDSEGEWLKPPLENFRVTCFIDKNGYEKPSGKIIYEMVDGVEVTKVAWEDMDD